MAPAQQIPVDGAARFEATAKIVRPALWSVDSPNLYTAVVTVKSGDKVRDAERVTFGVRTVEIYRGSWVLFERQAAQNPGNVQPPGSRGRWRRRTRPPAILSSGSAARDGLQCSAYLAQHAYARMGGRLRSQGARDDVRDAADEFEPRRPGPAGKHGQALPQLSVDHSLVDRQRRVATAERRG